MDSVTDNNNKLNHYTADCEHCFGLCCVALPFAKSIDFAFNKDGGTPCSNLQSNNRCGIHSQLRDRGLRGCTVYDCFGAGQHISQVTYQGQDWRNHPTTTQQMFDIFPIMQQLYEMLRYLHETLQREEASLIHQEIRRAIVETERLTNQEPDRLVNLDITAHRAVINNLLLQTSEIVRLKVINNVLQHKYTKLIKGRNLMGMNLRGANLSGANLRGVLLIASDLQDADMRLTDLIGADLRDANLAGANLEGSLFLTQAQVNSAMGSSKTNLPSNLFMPKHWLD